MWFKKKSHRKFCGIINGPSYQKSIILLQTFVISTNKNLFQRFYKDFKIQVSYEYNVMDF